MLGSEAKGGYPEYEPHACENKGYFTLLGEKGISIAVEATNLPPEQYAQKCCHSFFARIEDTTSIIEMISVQKEKATDAIHSMLL